MVHVFLVTILERAQQLYFGGPRITTPWH